MEIVCLNQPNNLAVCLCGHIAAEHDLSECEKCGCEHFLDERLWR